MTSEASNSKSYLVKLFESAHASLELVKYFCLPLLTRGKKMGENASKIRCQILWRI